MFIQDGCIGQFCQYRILKNIIRLWEISKELAYQVKRNRG